MSECWAAAWFHNIGGFSGGYASSLRINWSYSAIKHCSPAFKALPKNRRCNVLLCEIMMQKTTPWSCVMTKCYSVPVLSLARPFAIFTAAMLQIFHDWAISLGEDGNPLVWAGFAPPANAQGTALVPSAATVGPILQESQSIVQHAAAVRAPQLVEMGALPAIGPPLPAPRIMTQVRTNSGFEAIMMIELLPCFPIYS